MQVPSVQMLVISSQSLRLVLILAVFYFDVLSTSGIYLGRVCLEFIGRIRISVPRSLYQDASISRIGSFDDPSDLHPISTNSISKFIY